MSSPGRSAPGLPRRLTWVAGCSSLTLIPILTVSGIGSLGQVWVTAVLSSPVSGARGFSVTLLWLNPPTHLGGGYRTSDNDLTSH